jgi:hypothetical protein
MKRWFTKSVVLSIIALLVLALVPAASAEDELGTVFGEAYWLAECGYYTWNGIPVGIGGVDVTDRIPPEFFSINSFYAYSEEYGILADDTDVYGYTEFVEDSGYWWFIVPADGFTEMTIDVTDGGGLLHTTSTVTADCTTGTIGVSQGSIYGPKAPKNFVLRSLVGSSAVLDEPGGKQVEDNAVYAGQSWFVSPEPVVGPDGKNYTQIFVGGWKLGYIPTECIG